MLNCPIIIAKQQRSISHFGLAPINHFHKFSNCKKSKFQISVEGGVGVKKKARSGTDQYSDFRLDPDPRDYPFNIDLRDCGSFPAATCWYV